MSYSPTYSHSYAQSINRRFKIEPRGSSILNSNIGAKGNTSPDQSDALRFAPRDEASFTA
jgi:hypothetical protein